MSLSLALYSLSFVSNFKDGIIKLWDTEAANLIYKKKNIGLNMAKVSLIVTVLIKDYILL